MRREEAWDALEQAQALEKKVRPMGHWYAVYGIGYGVVSLTLLLSMGLSDSVMGVIVGTSFFALALSLLSLYMVKQPVKPLHYGKLHTWGIAGWGVIYSLAIVVGMIFFQGEPLWWVPMALLSAIPTSGAGLIVLRRAGRAR
ncbi:hypothetical protein [Nocardiopsis alkaliphila]|uniref:hypothetical protein n=1 Tax=Nocardiopsis alkaliphila TaxID=225762 RepID=UPI000348CD90|nr:hypothetical protein [Nocardiopsis alkaliphila]